MSDHFITRPTSIKPGCGCCPEGGGGGGGGGGGTLLLPCCTDRMFPNILFVSTSGGTTWDGAVTLPPINDVPVPYQSQLGGPGHTVLWQFPDSDPFVDTGVEIGGHTVYLQTWAVVSCSGQAGGAPLPWGVRFAIFWNGTTYYSRRSTATYAVDIDSCSPLSISLTEPASYPGSDLPGWTFDVTE